MEDEEREIEREKRGRAREEYASSFFARNVGEIKISAILR